MKLRYPKLAGLFPEVALSLMMLLVVGGAPGLLMAQATAEELPVADAHEGVQTEESQIGGEAQGGETDPEPSTLESSTLESSAPESSFPNPSSEESMESTESTESDADQQAATSQSDKSGADEHTLKLRNLYTNKSEANLFGTYRLRLFLGKPDMGDGIRFYDKLYGKPRGMLNMGVDWFAWDWYATMGIGFRAGVYRTKGYTFKKPADVALEDVTEEQITLGSPTTLTLIPLQVNALLQFTPFPRKWLVLDGWFGVERSYFQEVRNTKPSVAESGLRMAAASSEDDAKVYTNRGMKNAVVVGAAANFQLNWLDEGAARSLQTIGYRYVYLSPFFEIVRPLGDEEGVNFSRKVIGIGFTFESLK